MLYSCTKAKENKENHMEIKYIYSTICIFIEKCPHLNGLMQFKPIC